MRKRTWTLRQRLEITALIYIISLACNLVVSSLCILMVINPALHDAGESFDRQHRLEEIRSLGRHGRSLAEGDIASPIVASEYQRTAGEISLLAASLGRSTAPTGLETLWPRITAAIEGSNRAVEARRSLLAGDDGNRQRPALQADSFIDLDRLLSEGISVSGARREASVLRAADAQRWVVGLLLVNTLVGVILCMAGLWFVRKWVIQPVEELRRGTQQLSRGDLAARVSIPSEDEMGQLGEEVNKMAGRIAEMQSQLLERERRSAAGEMISHLESGLSGQLHEIRELADEALRDAKGDRDIGDFQKRIVSTTAGLERWLRDLKQTVVSSAPKLQTVAVDDMVQSVASVLRPILDQSRVDLRTSLDPGIGEVRVDRLQFEQAIIALLTNAVEASRPGQVVEIKVESVDGDPERWQMVVNDQGAGMPPEVLEKIFRPFFTTKPQGNGIGLGLVRAVIESHGGKLSVQSIPSRGTRFLAVLPRRLVES